MVAGCLIASYIEENRRPVFVEAQTFTHFVSKLFWFRIKFHQYKTFSNFEWTLIDQALVSDILMSTFAKNDLVEILPLLDFKKYWVPFLNEIY